ncbi:MAG: hypothetical protein K9M02_10780 [Thiohalocapsa sp.]|nr:hypothetical protein [Thiohalocapsa sp.]
MHAQVIPDDLIGAIHQLNRAYLHTARDLLRSGQIDMVEALFGLDDALSRWLADAPPEAIERLATTPGTLFRPRLPESTDKLLAVCSQAPERDITALHLLLRNLADQNGGTDASGGRTGKQATRR